MFKNVVISFLILSVSSAHGMWFRLCTNLMNPTNARNHVFKNFTPTKRQSIPKKVLGAATVTFAAALGVWGYCYSAAAEEQPIASVQTEFEKFAQKFAPPKDIQKTIEANNEKISRMSYGLIEGSPSIFAKGDDINRIINAERMRKCIEQNNLTTVAVAKKYIYKVDDEWRVFAENVDADSNGKDQLTLQEVQELTTLAEETGFRDWRGNILVNKHDEKMTFIDTEDDSFLLGMYRVEGIPRHCKAQYAVSLFLFKSSMDKRTDKWLSDRVNHLLNSQDGIIESKPLPLSIEFDNPDIDFEKAKQEFRRINAYNRALKKFDKDCVDRTKRHLRDEESCKKLINNLEKLSDLLKKEHNAKRYDIVGERQAAADYWKLVK